MSVIAFLICCLPVAQANEAPRDKQPPVALANKAFQGEGLRSLAWDARSKITSLDYRIKTHYEWLARNMSSDTLIHVKKQNTNLYQAIAFLIDANQKESAKNNVFIRNEREVITHFAPRGGPENLIGTRVFSDKTKHAAGGAYEHEMFNPSAIGMFPGLTLMTSQVAAFPDYLLPSRDSISNETVEPVTFQGEKCMKVTIELKGKGGIRRFWIAPDLDHAVLRCEAEFKNAKVPYLASIETVGGFLENPRIWFPTRYRVEIFEGGEKTHEEKSEIEVVSLNKPIDRDAFSLKALNLLPGTRVDVIPSSGNLIWDGKALSPAPRKP